MLLGKQRYSLEGSDQVRLCMSCIRTGKKEFLVIIVYVPWSFEGHGKKFGKNCLITLADAVVLLQSPPTVVRPNSLVLFYLFFENLIQIYNVSRLYHTHTPALSQDFLSYLSLNFMPPFYILLLTNLTTESNSHCPYMFGHGEPTGGKSPSPAAINGQAHSGWGGTGETLSRPC